MNKISVLFAMLSTDILDQSYSHHELRKGKGTGSVFIRINDSIIRAPCHLVLVFDEPPRIRSNSATINVFNSQSFDLGSRPSLGVLDMYY